MMTHAENVARSVRVPVRLKLALAMMAVFLLVDTALALIVLVDRRAAIAKLTQTGLESRLRYVATGIEREGYEISDADLATLSHSGPQPLAPGRVALTLSRESDGEVLASDPPMAHPVVDSNRPGSPPPHTMSRRIQTPAGQELLLTASTDGDLTSALLGEVAQVLTLSVAVGVIASGIAAWLLAGLATAPLEELRRFAGSFAPDVIEKEIDPASLTRQSAALQRDLQEVRARLVEALHAQDRFISNASHELKTPIAVLLTEAQTLRVDNLPAPARRFVQSVTEEMRLLGRMAESFLTLTRLRGGSAAVGVTVHSVNDFVVEAMASCSRMASQHHVVLGASLDEGEDELRVMGDAELLRVMLDNLMRNAIKFSPANGHAMIAVDRDNGSCIIRVTDEGPGIAPDVIDRLFDRFTQSAGEAPRGRGHGLGLSIAQGIAELHGGRITVRNKSQGGCEFAVRLTLAPAESKAGSAAARVRETQRHTEPTSEAAGASTQGRSTRRSRRHDAPPKTREDAPRR